MRSKRQVVAQLVETITQYITSHAIKILNLIQFCHNLNFNQLIRLMFFFLVTNNKTNEHFNILELIIISYKFRLSFYQKLFNRILSAVTLTELK